MACYRESLLDGSFVKSPLFLSDFNEIKIISTDFRKILKYQFFMKIRPVGAELFHGDGRTDGRTERKMDTTTLIEGFLNSAKAPTNTPLRRLDVDGRIIQEWMLIK